MHRRTILVATVMLTALLSLHSAQSAFSQQGPVAKYWSDNYGSFNLPNTNDYTWSVVAKAPPDECFFSLGDPNNLLSFGASYPAGLSTGYDHPCAFNDETEGIPKVNQAYLWGITKQGKDIWFGTVANTLCWVMEAMGMNQPLQMKTIACEGSLEKDVRPPQIYKYDTQQNTITDMVPQIIAAGAPHFERLQSTIGLRSAGSLNGVVFLGGITSSGVALFAFNATTNQFIDSMVFDGVDHPLYTNIRQWIVVKKQLYVGVAIQSPDFTSTHFVGSGEILHWIGNVTDPFKFETVGKLDGDPAYLAYFNKSIFVSTWGGPDDSSFGTVLSMSPQFTQQLTTADAEHWQTVWQLSNYEVEPSAAAAGGAIKGFDGWLYFTTMIPPGSQMMAFTTLYGQPKDNAATVEAFLGSYRPTVVFRGKDFGTSKQKIELLYGNTLLPKYDSTNSTWSLVPNNLHQTPKWGLAGFNNFFNSYTWWMEKFNGELFMGTFDWSYLLFESIFDYSSNIPPQVMATARNFEGADLLRLYSSSDVPVAVSLNGMGNYSNYGLRTMIVANGNMYLGTANPFNLLTDPVNDPYGKTGGWEMIKLSVVDPSIHGPGDTDEGDGN
jgi:hypothetical protein